MLRTEPDTLLAVETPRILNLDSSHPLIIVCEHAANHIPAPLNRLGLSQAQLEQHIAWDIGAGAVAERLAHRFGATAILATVSRLVVDGNRSPDAASLIPAISDTHMIPGNQGIGKAERARRIAAYYDPFHQAVDAVTRRRHQSGRPTLVIGMHSFEPAYQGHSRPWEIGFLYRDDRRLYSAFTQQLNTHYDFTIGDNQPYSGWDLYYSMQRHGADWGFPQVTVEVRNDLIGDRAGQQAWAEILSRCLDAIIDDNLAGHHR